MSGWLIGDDRDYALDNGHLVLDDTPATAARMRLLTRRGQWFADPEFGSRIHTIKTTKNIAATLELFAREALAPMLEDGQIQSIDQVLIQVDPRTNATFGQILATVGDQPVDLGSIPLLGIFTPLETSTARSSVGDLRGTGIAAAAQTDLYQDREIAGGNVGYGWLINDDRDYEINDGLLVRDSTLKTRCRIRLLTRRGQWVADPDMGSLLHTIKITKDIEPTVLRMARSALQPLIDSGEILAVNLTDVIQRVTSFVATIEIVTPGGSVFPISEEFGGIDAAA
jgi:phage gp46-like protein